MEQKTKPEEMHYTVLKYSDNDLTGYLSFSYSELEEHLQEIIDYFKKASGYPEFLVLENETGKMVKLELIEMKKAQLSTKYGVKCK